jgi:aryl-alcohol dehydrogenase-like predicted oxidoreductase
VSTAADTADPPLLGMGCMRLSTEPDRDPDAAIAVLHAAFDAGITFFDTANAYCRDATETGHNERLISRALATWTGDRSSIVVATKGGLMRPQGHWVEDGRARALVSSCEASCRALAVDRIQLYQLHAPDPRTPLSTSIRALAGLQRDGLIDRIGLCNVTVGQIEEAGRIADITSVQIELGVWHDAGVLSGVVEYCLAHGIKLIAHRPLGGVRRRRRTLADAALTTVAERHGATPFEIALAWLTDLSRRILPIPGPTRVETVRSIARARHIRFSDEDRVVLDERFPAGRVLRGARPGLASPRVDGEIVLIMGLPGAGKSALARTFVAEGYERLNRDEAGGSLASLLPAIDRLLVSGRTRIALDNTYISRKARAPVIQAAQQRGLQVRCVWLSTDLEDAQVNAACRIVSKYGKLLGPQEMRAVSKRDVNTFGPKVQFRYQRELEPPVPAEGFSRIDIVPFVRARDASFTNRAVIVWCDGMVLRSRSGRRSPASVEDVEIVPEHVEKLRRYASEGWLLFGLSWRPEIAANELSVDEAGAIFERAGELLGMPLPVLYCPHAAGPPLCWCRKPLPGLGVTLIQQHQLDATQCVYVGAGPQDPGFARRLGFRYVEAAEFFAGREPTE